jgi:acyl carrier protein
MITEVETKTKIREYIVKSTLADVKNLSDDTLIFESGLLDSMGLLFLIEYLKEEFQVEVQDDELLPANFKSINSIVSFMEGKLSE